MPPEISDAAYDAGFRRLQAIEQRFPGLASSESPTATVGAAPAGGFRKVAHRVPMLSLGNAFSREDVADFVDGVRHFLREWRADPTLDLPFLAELKIDGCPARFAMSIGGWSWQQRAAMGRRARMSPPTRSPWQTCRNR